MKKSKKSKKSKKPKPSEKERLRDRCESTSGVGNKCPEDEGFITNIKKHSGKIAGASLVVIAAGIGLTAYLMSGTEGEGQPNNPGNQGSGDNSGNNTADKFLQLIKDNEGGNITFQEFKTWVNQNGINLSEAYILWMNYAGPWWKIPADAARLGVPDAELDVIDEEDYQHIRNEINDFIKMDADNSGEIHTDEYIAGQPMMRRIGDSDAVAARTPDAAGEEEYPSNKYWCNDLQVWRLMHRPRPGNLSNQLTFPNDGNPGGENRYPKLSTNGSGRYREILESTDNPRRPPSSLLERKGHAGDGRANYWRDGETIQEPEWVSKKRGTDCIPEKDFSEENKGECCVGASRKKYLQDNYRTPDDLKEGMRELDNIYSHAGVSNESPQYKAVNKMMTENHDVSINELIDEVLKVEGTDGEIGDPNIRYANLLGPDTYWEKIAGEPEQPRYTPPPWVPPEDWVNEFPRSS